MRFITIHGKKRPVAFKMAAIRIFYELTGSNLLKEDVTKIFTEDLNAKKISSLVYAAMYCGAYPNIDFCYEDVEAWLELDTNIYSEVLMAFIDFVPKDPNVSSPKEGEKEEEKLTGILSSR